MIEPCLGRLLIVDDEAPLLDALCEMLTEQHYRTVGFASSRDALEELKQHDYDVLLSDLMMPDMDGVTLVRAALEVDPSLIAIIMTGQGTVQTAVEAMKIGAFDYVLKPFKLNALMPILSRAMELRKVKLENLQLRETVAMNDLVQAVALTLDRNTILRKVADAARQQCHADEVSIMLPIDGTRELCVMLVDGEGREAILGERVPIERGIAGWAAVHNETLTLQGNVDDPRFSSLRARDTIHSSISMPMKVGNKLVGVLNVNSTKGARPFTTGQVKALSILANVAAPTLEISRLHEEVLEAEGRYRSIFENAIEGMFQKVVGGQITAANPALARILGYDQPSDLMLWNTDIWTELYVDPGRRVAFIEEVESAGLVQGFEAQMYRKDRSKIWVSLNARAIRDPTGKLIRYEGGIEDITERKGLEEQLVQSQKMEAIGRLAGGVAHDFNNLLTAIIGYSQMVLARLHRDDPMRKEVEEIEKAGQRAAGLTSQLLAFSRRQVVQPQVLNLNAVVTEVSKLLNRVIGEDVELTTALDPETGLVKADRGQIEQIIMNLAINSRDAMNDGGRLTVETSNVELDDAYANEHVDVRAGPHVMLAISDNGCGMDRETQSHIFEPFFTTKEVGKGTGLGLSMVYGIVKQSGGHIGLYTEPGRGASFKVYLPRIEESVVCRELCGQKAESPTGAEIILLVEDEDAVRKLARKILETGGYTVLEASGGDQTRLVCVQHEGPIHLLLTDIVMKGPSGREVAENLAPLRPGMKVLYMSGYTDDAIVRHGVFEASTPFLAKPFTCDTLLRKVRDVLDA